MKGLKGKKALANLEIKANVLKITFGHRMGLPKTLLFSTDIIYAFRKDPLDGEGVEVRTGPEWISSLSRRLLEREATVMTWLLIKTVNRVGKGTNTSDYEY